MKMHRAIDATTGTVIWKLQNSSFTTTPVVATCTSSSNNVEPFVGGNTVYSLFATITNSSQTSTEASYIDAFNASTGALLWEYNIPDSHGQSGPNAPNFNVIGADNSAVYYENSVGTITALSATNHRVLSGTTRLPARIESVGTGNHAAGSRI